jgi:hypothetical protein
VEQAKYGSVDQLGRTSDMMPLKTSKHAEPDLVGIGVAENQLHESGEKRTFTAEVAPRYSPFNLMRTPRSGERPSPRHACPA